MDDLWRSVGGLNGQRLYTVMGKPFDILSVTAETVEIRVGSTDKIRPIPRHEFEDASRLKQAGIRLRPIDIRERVPLR